MWCMGGLSQRGGGLSVESRKAQSLVHCFSLFMLMIWLGHLRTWTLSCLRQLLSLYNGLVLPHLQYCLMVWGDFVGDRNATLAGALLGYQKRFAGLAAGRRGRYHADRLLAEHGMLKLGDLYRQQLRVHAWRFWNGQLPTNQAAMLSRAADVHGYGTRSARQGLHLASRDHGSVGYRVPTEWASLTDELRGMGSLAGFKRRSRGGFLAVYGASVCLVRGCYVCGRERRQEERNVGHGEGESGE